VHETTIEASPERTYRTICAVTVNEITLLRTLIFFAFECSTGGSGAARTVRADRSAAGSGFAQRLADEFEALAVRFDELRSPLE
jgi:hypothetical protein